MSKKIELTLDDDTVNILETLQQATGVDNITEVFKRGLGLYYWSYRRHCEGYTMLISKDENDVQEVLLGFDDDD